ncbi:MAG: hypothetical protein WAM39_08650, partial [Bryobacteraceae bacterium]
MTRTPLVTTMMPVDTIKIGERIGRGLGDLPSLTADFAIEPIGRRYEKAMAEWLVANSFKEIDKGTGAACSIALNIELRLRHG